MKLDWKAVLIFTVLVLVLGFYIGRSCSDNENLTGINRAIAESKKQVGKLQEDIKALNDSLSALAINRIENKNYYTYETYKIDSLIQLDSSLVNAIIRSRLARLLRLQGFFFTAIDTNRTEFISKGSSSW